VNNNARNTPTFGSNGSKHSRFQRSETERSNTANFQVPSNSRNHDQDLESNFLCSHYKRHCYVKFKCCDKFWPCHRCHNNQSACGQRKLKSRDTMMVKCACCNKVQQVIEILYCGNNTLSRGFIFYLSVGWSGSEMIFLYLQLSSRRIRKLAQIKDAHCQ
jgi:uncharacterized CHY-type Zn-finger protein